jgi:hypothetical protein
MSSQARILKPGFDTDEPMLDALALPHLTAKSGTMKRAKIY